MKRNARFAGIGLCLALVAGTAFAARQSTTFEYFFPGVYSDGELAFDELGADGTVRVTYNTRTDRLRIVGRAVVNNLSKRKQVYPDAGVFDDYGIDGDVVRDRYTVGKRGSAAYLGIARNVDIDLDDF